jgi:hypothetical protein
MQHPEEFSQKLLVEGSDDLNVILHLCRTNNININFDLIDCGGIKNLFDQVPIRLKQPDIETIGIIIDADENINGRWQRLSALLTTAGFQLPANMSNAGLIISHPNTEVRIGIWIMPDNSVNGILEDFIRFLVPADDNLLPIANETLLEIERNNHNRYAMIHKPKALIHTWLAWQEEPGVPMGLAITKRYLNTAEEVCQRLIGWLRETFE